MSSEGLNLASIVSVCLHALDIAENRGILTVRSVFNWYVTPGIRAPMELYAINRLDWGAGSPFLGCGGGSNLTESTVKR